MQYGTSGAKIPNATSSDKSGERMEKMKDGVAMGKMDATGKDCEFNTGKTSGICYEHKRTAYAKEDANQK